MVKVFISILAIGIVLLLTSNAPAQSPTQQSSGETQSAKSQRPDGASQASQQDQSREKRKTASLKLLNGIVAESANLSLPENKVWINTIAASLLWTTDQRRARGLFNQAAADLAGLANGIGSDQRDSRRAQLIGSLRSSLVYTVARLDPQLALAILNQTSSQLSGQPSVFTAQVDPDTFMSLSIAAQIASQQPEQAFKLAEDSLKSKPAFPLIGVLSALQTSSADYAAKLAGDINSALTAGDIVSDTNSANLALSLIRLAMNSSAASTGGSASTDAPLLSTQDIQGLIGKLTQSVSFGGQGLQAPETSAVARYVLGTLNSMSDMVKLFDPDAATTIAQKFATSSVYADPATQAWQKFQEAAQSATPAELITAAASAPQGMQSNYYQQAVWKAAQGGDLNSARQIMDQYISDPTQRDQLEQPLARMGALKEIRAGKIDAARQIVSHVASREARASMLCELASTLDREKNKTAILSLLDEARSLLPEVAGNYNQLSILRKIASAYAGVDTGKSVQTFKGIAAKLNSLITAAQALEGFDVQGIFENGEVVMQPSTQLVTEFAGFGESLGEIGMNDLDGAIAAASTLDRVDTRLMTELAICQHVMSKDNRIGDVPMAIETGRVDM